MFGRISSLFLSGCATAAIGLSFASQAGAQPYYGEPGYDRPAYDQSDYGGARVGEVIVTPGYRPDRTYNGIPTERVYASRVVNISDLDLSTDWGVHELHARVVRAAADACDQLDRQWPQGLYPIDSNDGDCKARAIRHAMAQAPITYEGYGYRYSYGY